MAFGDLCLQDVRSYREERMRGAGIEAIFSLWEKPTRGLFPEMLAGGQQLFPAVSYLPALSCKIGQGNGESAFGLHDVRHYHHKK